MNGLVFLSISGISLSCFYLQTRGSMPFLWEQIVDLKYKPKFEIVKPEEAVRFMEHFP